MSVLRLTSPVVCKMVAVVALVGNLAEERAPLERSGLTILAKAEFLVVSL